MALFRPVASVPKPISGRAPVANPVFGTNPIFGINSLPQPGGVQARGLPSPSVGTVLAQSRTAPPPALSGLPFATPTIGASFGGSSPVAPSLNPVGHPLTNLIGEKY